MKFTFLQCINLGLFCCFCTCSSPQSKKEINENKEPIINTVEEKSTNIIDSKKAIETIIIERAYATSFQKGFDIQTLFDNDKNTYFQTKKGTGPNEGIMFYFSKPTSLHHLKIDIDESSILETVEFFVNGTMVSINKCKDKIMVDDAVSSLFIKFKKTTQNQKRKLTEQEIQFLGMGGDFSELLSFPIDKQITLKNISFFKNEEEEFNVILPKKIQGTVTASSILNPTIAYQPANLFDAYLSSAWVEGNESTGNGEKLTFVSNTNKTFQKVKIWNGYQRSSSHFTANCSAKKIRLQNEVIELKDEEQGQLFSLTNPISIQNFSLTIDEVYDENKKYKDLAISELVFFDENDEPFIFNCEKQFVKTSSSILKNILNKSIENIIEDGMEACRKSIILRDDFTFVYYNTYSEEMDNKQTIAEGNWEIVKESTKDITIKLFGKKHIATMNYQLYGENDNDETSHIFTDIITINDKQLIGGKHIENFVTQ